MQRNGIRHRHGMAGGYVAGAESAESSWKPGESDQAVCKAEKTAMAQADRYPEIPGIAGREGKVSVEGRASLGVTGKTIRHDLADAGRLERVHGGAILTQARRVFLLADHSKLTRAAPARIASVDRVDGVCTEQTLPPALAARCRDLGARSRSRGKGAAP